jgi:hypothetical protein
MGALFGGVVYWLLARRTIPAEVAQTPSLQDEDAAIAAMSPPA